MTYPKSPQAQTTPQSASTWPEQAQGGQTHLTAHGLSLDMGIPISALSTSTAERFGALRRGAGVRMGGGDRQKAARWGGMVVRSVYWTK